MAFRQLRYRSPTPPVSSNTPNDPNNSCLKCCVWSLFARHCLHQRSTRRQAATSRRIQNKNEQHIHSRYDNDTEQLLAAWTRVRAATLLFLWLRLVPGHLRPRHRRSSGRRWHEPIASFVLTGDSLPVLHERQVRSVSWSF